MVGRCQIGDGGGWGVLHLQRVLRGLVLIIDNKAYLVFKITSCLGREGYIIRDLSAAGLLKESVVRTDVVVQVSVSDLRYQMGTLSDADSIGLISYTRFHQFGCHLAGTAITARIFSGNFDVMLKRCVTIDA